MSACPVCGVVSGPCKAVDKRTLPTFHIEREALTVTPIYSELLVRGLS